jgi:hypothetical protein
MSGTTVGIVAIVVVAAAGLVVLIGLVFHAERHPDTGRGSVPRRKIIGGIFQGDPRQQMPRRDAPAEVISDSDFHPEERRPSSS